MSARLTRLVGNLRTVTDELRRDGRGRILVTVAAGWFLLTGVRFIYPPLLPFFRDEFGFGLTVAGSLVSFLWFAYALGQFPGGVLGDRLGGGNILTISLAASTGAVLVVATAANVWMLFAGTLVFGFATALYGPTRVTIFTDVYDERAGTAIGLSYAAGSVGNTALPAMAAGIASYTTWRLGYGVLVPVFVATAVALWLAVPGRPSSHEQPTEIGPGLIRQIVSGITRNGIPTVVAIQVVLGFVNQGFLGFYPIYLIETKGFSPTVAAVLFSLYFAVGVLVQLLAGVVSDWLGPRVTLAVTAGLYFAGLVALHFAQTVPQVVALTVLLSHRNGTGVVTNTFIADSLVDDIKGSGLGFLRTGWILIGATSPILVGYLGDSGLLRRAFLLLAALAGIATALTVFMPDRAGEQSSG